MSSLCARLRAARSSGESGSALAIALVFLMIFGLYVGTVLQFASAGQRSAVAVRDEATNTYSGDGAIDGAINAVRGTLSTGIDPGTASPPASSPCPFVLPANALGNPTPVSVTCQPQAGSGGSAGSLASQPAQAILALSGVTSEGVVLATTAKVATQGAVFATKRVDVPAGATLTSTDLIKASDCSRALGAVTPSCTTSAVPGAPVWPGPTAYPPVVPKNQLPSCTDTYIEFIPGTYLSKADIQGLFNCPTNKVVLFRPGVYYFDFRDGGTNGDRLIINSTDVVVGGTPSSTWTPGVTSPGAVPLPVAGPPATSACKYDAQGVDFVFGGDSRFDVQAGGRLELCAEQFGTSAQNIVVRGLSANSAPLPSSSPSVLPASNASSGGSGNNWSSPGSGDVVDGSLASVTASAGGSSRRLTVSGFSSLALPPEATGVNLSFEVTETLSGPGKVTLTFHPGTGGAAIGPLTLHDCAVIPCTDNAFVAGKTDIVSIPGLLTYDQVNGMSVDLTVTSPSGGSTKTWVDGVVATATSFSAFLRPTCPINSTTGGCAAGLTITSILKTAATAVLGLHGTVAAPLASVDLGQTNVSYVVVDRGLVVRTATLSMTPTSGASGYTGPLISVPVPFQDPRQVLMTAKVGSVTLAQALVTFANVSGGTANGTNVTVTQWSVS